MDDLRWAVMGTGMIARKVLGLIDAAPGCRVTCVASREIERARAFAGEMELAASAACTYDQLLDRTDVDAVYVTLPNHLHGEWCIRLLEGKGGRGGAGKHVLCEKPLTPFKTEAQAIFDAAERAQRTAVEGFMYMHHPQTARLVEIARDAIATAAPRQCHPIGPLRRIDGWFDIHLVDVPHAWTRFLHSMWGGALMDLGCYPVGLSRLVTGAEPRVVSATAEWAGIPDGETKPVDLSSSVELEFDVAGRTIPASIHSSMGCADKRRIGFRMEGEWGAIETDTPFRPEPETAVLRVERNTSHPAGPGRDDIVIEHGGDRFTNQAADFAAVVRGAGAPLPTPAWSIAQAGVLEEILSRMGLRFEA